MPVMALLQVLTKTLRFWGQHQQSTFQDSGCIHCKSVKPEMLVQYRFVCNVTSKQIGEPGAEDVTINKTHGFKDYKSEWRAKIRRLLDRNPSIIRSAGSKRKGKASSYKNHSKKRKYGGKRADLLFHSAKLNAKLKKRRKEKKSRRTTAKTIRYHSQGYTCTTVLSKLSAMDPIWNRQATNFYTSTSTRVELQKLVSP